MQSRWSFYFKAAAGFQHLESCARTEAARPASVLSCMFVYAQQSREPWRERRRLMLN